MDETRFCLQIVKEASREQMAIVNASRTMGYSYHFANECPEGDIPIGDVPFCEKVFGRQPYIKDFYPDFLYLHRNRFIDFSVITPEWSRGMQAGLFIKDATQWKSDMGARISKDGERLPVVHWWSEVVEFTDEWRWYVADGEVIDIGWYQGQNEDSEPPPLNIAWPSGFSGAVDFGLCNGKLTLVEAHAPFACGWYGDDCELFALWQAVAWNYSSFWKKEQ